MVDINIKSIKPMFTTVITTCNGFEQDYYKNGLIQYKAGTTKDYQTVLAVGSSVRDILVGDVVWINPAAYKTTKHDPNSVKEDMVMNKVVNYDIPMLELDGKQCMMLQDRDIKFVITDYEKVEGDSVITTPKLIV